MGSCGHVDERHEPDGGLWLWELGETIPTHVAVARLANLVREAEA